MVKEIIWSDNAVKDRLKIYDFWLKHNKSETYSKKLEKLFKHTALLLSNFPQIGTNTNYKNTKIKIVLNFKIFYVVAKDKIIILRIWDSRQNSEKIKL